MYKLNGIFNGEDMGLFVPVDKIDHSRQRGGLTTTGGPRHQYHSFVLHRHLQYRHRILRHPDFLPDIFGWDLTPPQYGFGSGGLDGYLPAFLPGIGEPL